MRLPQYSYTEKERERERGRKLVLVTQCAIESFTRVLD